jgi:hypothetical protein
VGLFKKKKEKLKDDIAVGSTMNALIQHVDIEGEWIKEQLESVGFIYDDSRKSWVNFEIVHPSLSLECIALNNLFKEHEADYLYKLTIEILEELEDVNEYALDSVQNYYLPAIHQAINQNNNPLDMVCSILYQKLSQHLAIHEDQNNYDFMGAITMQFVVGKFLGKWKSTQELFEIQFS